MLIIENRDKIEKLSRCYFGFLPITFLFGKISNRDRFQITPYSEGFRTIYSKYKFSKKKFWDKTRVEWGMLFTQLLNNGKLKSKSEKRFRKMKKKGWKTKKNS